MDLNFAFNIYKKRMLLFEIFATLLGRFLVVIGKFLMS